MQASNRSTKENHQKHKTEATPRSESKGTIQSNQQLSINSLQAADRSISNRESSNHPSMNNMRVVSRSADVTASFAIAPVQQEDTITAAAAIIVDDGDDGRLGQRLQDDSHRTTAISYECGSDVYLAALLEAIDHPAADGGIDGRNNDDAAAALGATVLHTIQDRFVEKHVRNGTLTPKTIRVASSPTNTAVRAVASTMGQEADGSFQRAPASRPRRGRRRPPLPRPPQNVRNSTEEDRSRRILSFNRQAE